MGLLPDESFILQGFLTAQGFAHGFCVAHGFEQGFAHGFFIAHGFEQGFLKLHGLFVCSAWATETMEVLKMKAATTKTVTISAMGAIFPILRILTSFLLKLAWARVLNRSVQQSMLFSVPRPLLLSLLYASWLIECS